MQVYLHILVFSKCIRDMKLYMVEHLRNNYCFLLVSLTMCERGGTNNCLDALCNGIRNVQIGAHFH